MAGADAEPLGIRLIQHQLGVFHGLGERFFHIQVTAGLDRHACKGSMGRRGRDDMNDVQPLRREQLLRGSKTPDARHDVAHGCLCRIGRIRDGNQLDTGAAQNRTSVVLRVAAGADQRDSQRT